MIVTPEMSGKIVDESHFKFHVECKAKIVNAYNKLRDGADFLKSLSKLDFTTDKRWTQNTCKDPNITVLMGILEDYKKVEHRPARAKLLIPIIEYAIGLYASDLFYRERGEWFMYQLISRSKQMAFADVFLDPNNWYPMTRNSSGEGTNGNLYKWENLPNAPDINEEYRLWYGVDPTDDKCVISYDMKRRDELIASQIKWCEENDGTKWAKEELKKIDEEKACM
jgi:hypothetical protein